MRNTSSTPNKNKNKKKSEKPSVFASFQKESDSSKQKKVCIEVIDKTNQTTKQKMASISRSSRAILNVLTTPSKIASKFDWKRTGGASVLSLDINQDRINLAVASHPSSSSSITTSSTTPTTPTTKTLKSIKLSGRKGRVSNICRQELADVISKYQVCGVVVTWPLQHDTGKMGAACGRVLYTLEHLLLDDNNELTNLLTPNRPFCLWEERRRKFKNEKEEENEQDDDDDDYDEILKEDGFGRSIAYSRVPAKTKTIHRASEEQYYFNNNNSSSSSSSNIHNNNNNNNNQQQQHHAAKVWDDFFKTHWPDLHRQQERQKERQKFVSARNNNNNNTSSSYVLQENWEDTSSYVNVALL